ncbi:hypothetical protein WA026_023706 [Henosepilachna vigintioctopunctata]|uniref:t-SNARE coiled-coil homology domain-containing protein n=1 Tax=Henosepilachna vigintioctopunctata TaxID=420089 RepID=A0AAW1UR58_9CUCU
MTAKTCNGNTQSPATLEDIRVVIGDTHNWKVPRPDGLHSYWLKNSWCAHRKLTVIIIALLSDLQTMPSLLRQGGTYVSLRDQTNKTQPNIARFGVCTSKKWNLKYNGGFTERQKNILKRIYEDMLEELMRDTVHNTVFMYSIAKQVADMITERINENIERINLAIQSIQNVMSNIKGESTELEQNIEDLKQDSKLHNLQFHGTRGSTFIEV